MWSCLSGQGIFLYSNRQNIHYPIRIYAKVVRDFQMLMKHTGGFCWAWKNAA